jgi:Domain of unknown function (DUF4397)
MKQFVLSLSLLALAITCSCGGGSNSMTNSSAQLRAIQTSGDLPGFDVQLDHRPLFSKGSDFTYKPVPAGSHNLQALAPGTSSVLTSLPANLAANTSQSLIIAGATEDQSLTSFLIAEDTTPPATGQIKLRFVHGAHALGPIDIYITDAGTLFPSTPTFANLSYKSETAVLSRPAGGFSLCWTAAGTTTPFGGAPCPNVGTFLMDKFTNSTFVLPDAPIVPNAPPGTFTIIQFRAFPN